MASPRSTRRGGAGSICGQAGRVKTRSFHEVLYSEVLPPATSEFRAAPCAAAARVRGYCGSAVPQTGGDTGRCVDHRRSSCEKIERDARLQLAADVLGSFAPVASSPSNASAAAAAAAVAAAAARKEAAAAEAAAFMPRPPPQGRKSQGKGEETCWGSGARAAQQQAAVAHKRAAAAGFRAARIRASLGVAKTGPHQPNRGSLEADIPYTISEPPSLKRSGGAIGAVTPPAVDEFPPSKTKSETIDASFVVLPPHLLLHFSVWLSPLELIRLLMTHSSYAAATDLVAAWVMHDRYGFGSERCAVQQRLHQISTLRIFRYTELCREAMERSRHRQLAAGLQHSMTVRDGIAYSWGGTASGQLGRGSPAERFHPVPTPIPLVMPVASIACGGDHSLLVTTCGSVWAFGRNSDGQLGLGSDRDSPRPLQMPVPQAVQAACGADHSLVLAADASIWACGRGVEGQLGVDLPAGEDRALMPLCVFAVSSEVRHVACGADHSVILDVDGIVYSFGENSKGQLGLGHRDNQYLPAQMPLHDGALIVDVDCGGTHTLLVTDDFHVFGCGGNDQGQLGAGWLGDKLLAAPVLLRTGADDATRGPGPLQLPVVARANRVSCGFGHSLLLSRSGVVWVLGSRGSNAGRGNSSETSVLNYSPWRVRGVLERAAVDDVACGGGHALCVIGCGDMFSISFGSLNRQQRVEDIDDQRAPCQTPAPQLVAV